MTNHFFLFLQQIWTQVYVSSTQIGAHTRKGVDGSRNSVPSSYCCKCGLIFNRVWAAVFKLSFSLCCCCSSNLEGSLPSIHQVVPFIVFSLNRPRKLLLRETITYNLWVNANFKQRLLMACRIASTKRFTVAWGWDFSQLFCSGSRCKEQLALLLFIYLF